MSQICFFGKSDTGLKRKNNEDAFLIRPEAGLMAVADGMGGAAAGEVASQIFIQAVLETSSKISPQTESEMIHLVQNTFQSANERILQHVQEQPQHQGMGCTAEFIVFGHQIYALGHVGDSRTYLLRNGQLRQITKDHSVVQDQIDQGLIKPEEARKHPLRNVILRSVGIREELALDLIRGKIQPGDLFLLCSDGLTDMIDDASVQEILSSSLSLTQKGEELIGSALSAGGYDNVTVAMCEVIQP
ncbi:MAG: Stp1/IreP family PP2C-type Ser/Thr phosphatase [bacterium]